MKILFKLYATLTDYLPPAARANKVDVEIDPADTIEVILNRHNVPDRLVHLVLVNGVFVPREARGTRCLAEGDTLAVWPPIAGG